MREIKYRGKRIDTGEWIFGNLIGNDVIVGDIVDWDDEYFCTEFWHKVDPETVGQYTGMKDINQKDIYEGDIVQIQGHPFEGPMQINGNYEVGYNDRMELCCGSLLLHRERHYATVIGNKFENPSLLEVTNE